MDLDSLGRNLVARLGGIVLGHRAVHGGLGIILVLHLSGEVHQLLGGGQLRRHVGDHEGNRLVLADGLAELDALLGVLDGLIEAALRDADGLGGNTQTAAVERLHRVDEAHVLLAEHVALVDADVLEHHVAGGIADDAHLRLVLTAGDTGGLHVDDEGGDALVALGHVGLGIDDAVVGDGSAGDKALTAIEDVVVAVLRGGGDHAARVGAGARLGQREDDLDLVLHGGHEILLELLLGAGLHQGAAAEGVGGVGIEARHRGNAGDLLDHNHIGQRVRACAAVFTGNLQTQKAALGHLFHDLLGELARFLDTVEHLGRQFRLSELAHELTDHFMLCVENHTFPPVLSVQTAASFSRESRGWTCRRSESRRCCSRRTRPSARRPPR